MTAARADGGGLLQSLALDRRALHEIPEIGYDLPETQAYIVNALSRLRARVETVSPAGVLAYFDFGARETFAFRTDMDALPISEPVGEAFVSRHPGKMHACGHDGHMAMLLALARVLSARPAIGPRNALLLFQPAEESGNGAKVMLESGAMEKYRVREIYAAHVEPSLPLGAIASRPGAFMARSSEVHAYIRGKSAHIARAREGIDALEMGARFYLAAIDHIERAYADDAHLFKFGRFVSGTANNIVSDFSQIDGSLRAFDDGVFARMREDISRIARETAARFGGEIDVQIDEGYPPLINDEKCFQRLARAARGMDFRALPAPHMTAEDFACYLSRAPGLMFNVGLGADAELHSPLFRFDERALLYGVRAFLGVLDDGGCET